MLVRILSLASAALVLSAAPVSAAEPAERTPLDESIDRALDFLSKEQDPGGAWAVNGQRNPAISALSVMAFLSAGHIPGEGRYGNTVERGVRYVMSTQRADGLFSLGGFGEMYIHGICTLMLAEAAGMTDGKLSDEIRQRLEKAILVILKGQRTGGGQDRGGWRYQVYGNDADISVTGWQVMALRAAKNLGCDIPPEHISEAVNYIRRCYDPSRGGFKYTTYAGVTTPCTGTSILALELCGKDFHRSPESLKAGAFILKNPPEMTRQHYFYGTYYCAQAMFQLGDNYWKSYRGLLHEQLLRTQRPNGMWVGRAPDDASYGPNYCTAMAVLALTVEYRYLPIYQRGEEPNEKEP
jgi:hypothetical protein